MGRSLAAAFEAQCVRFPCFPFPIRDVGGFFLPFDLQEPHGCLEYSMSVSREDAGGPWLSNNFRCPYNLLVTLWIFSQFSTPSHPPLGSLDPFSIRSFRPLSGMAAPFPLPSA